MPTSAEGQVQRGRTVQVTTFLKAWHQQVQVTIFNDFKSNLPFFIYLNVEQIVMWNGSYLV